MGGIRTHNFQIDSRRLAVSYHHSLPIQYQKWLKIVKIINTNTNLPSISYVLLLNDDVDVVVNMSSTVYFFTVNNERLSYDTSAASEFRTADGVVHNAERDLSDY